MYKNCLLPALLLCCSTFLPAQSKAILTSRQPLGFSPANNTQINGLALGAVHFWDEKKSGEINGVGIEIGMGILMLAIPFTFSTFPDSKVAHFDTMQIRHRLNGLSISATGFIDHSNVSGLSLNGLGSSTYHMRGVQIAGVSCVNWELSGFALCFIGNDAHRSQGFQAAFLYSSSTDHKGLQIGCFNLAHKLRGVQIGLFNESKNMRGVQFGLWNVNQKRKLPFFNWG